MPGTTMHVLQGSMKAAGAESVLIWVMNAVAKAGGMCRGRASGFAGAERRHVRVTPRWDGQAASAQGAASRRVRLSSITGRAYPH